MKGDGGWVEGIGRRKDYYLRGILGSNGGGNGVDIGGGGGRVDWRMRRIIIRGMRCED
jgi:hypothetical protein